MFRHFERAHMNTSILHYNFEAEAKFELCSICGCLNGSCACKDGKTMEDGDLDLQLRLHLACPTNVLYTRWCTKKMHQL